MFSTRRIAALSAMFLLLFQGCDSRSATASGDRSIDGKGVVAFRLSPTNIQTLRQECVAVRVQISGPGISTPILHRFTLDSTDVLLADIPSGTRYVQVSAIDSAGRAYWAGADTVEVNPDSTTYAHIVLHRQQLPSGQIYLDLSLDRGPDTIAPVDTIPRAKPLGDSTNAFGGWSPFWTCKHQGPFGYCLDPELRDTSRVGLWNCTTWRYDSATSHVSCMIPLAPVETTPPDTFCAVAYQGVPKVCKLYRTVTGLYTDSAP